MIFSALYLCIAKQLFIISSLVLKANIILNISDVVLYTDNFTVKYKGPITFSTFYPKMAFSTRLFYPKYHMRHPVYWNFSCASISRALSALWKYMICRNLDKMLRITLVRLWNGANLSIYDHVTHFASNTRHKTCHHLGVTRLVNILSQYANISSKRARDLKWVSVALKQSVSANRQICIVTTPWHPHDDMVWIIW